MSGNARRSSAWDTVVASVTLGCLAGCSTPPEPVPPLPAPPVRVEARWFAGTPLSGPRPGETEKISAADAVGVRLSLFALEKIPESLLEPLGSRTILIASAREDTPVHAATKLSLGARIGEPADLPALLQDLESGNLGRSAFISNSSAALPRGATCVFRLEAGAGAADPDEGRAEIQLYRPSPEPGQQAAGSPEGLHLALGLEGLATDEGTGTGGGTARATGTAGGDAARSGNAESRGDTESPRPALRREILLVDPELNPAAKPVALIFPSPFKKWPTLALAAIVEVSASPDAKALAGSAPLVEAGADEPGAEGKLTAAVNPLEALAFPLRRRKALLFLATSASARLTESAALTGDDDVLGRICARILEKAGKDEQKEEKVEAKRESKDEGKQETKDEGKQEAKQEAKQEGKSHKTDLLWLLESSTLEVLSALVADQQTSPEIEALLLRFAGQAGRQAMSMEKALRGSRGVDDLKRLLVEENFLSLEDSSPAARARALRWLEERGLAPAGYDPLASPKERRAALEKALAGEAKPEEGGKP